MSKYRFIPSYSKLGKNVILASFLILLLSVWSWQPNVIQWQSALQCLVSLVIIVAGYRNLTRFNQQTPVPITLSENGQWTEHHEINQGESESWQVSYQSKLTRYVLWVHLQSLTQASSKWVMIYHDQVSVRDYRRLCRTIRFRQFVWRRDKLT